MQISKLDKEGISGQSGDFIDHRQNAAIWKQFVGQGKTLAPMTGGFIKILITYECTFLERSLKRQENYFCI